MQDPSHGTPDVDCSRGTAGCKPITQIYTSAHTFTAPAAPADETGSADGSFVGQVVAFSFLIVSLVIVALLFMACHFHRKRLVAQATQYSVTEMVMCFLKSSLPTGLPTLDFLLFSPFRHLRHLHVSLACFTCWHFLDHVLSIILELTLYRNFCPTG